MFLYNGIKIKEFVIINDIQYPIEFIESLDTKELESFGIVYHKDPVLPDPRFYTWTENEDGSIKASPIISAMSIEKQMANNKIFSLEMSVTNRRLREAQLTESGLNWLKDIEKQIEDLRLVK